MAAKAKMKTHSAFSKVAVLRFGSPSPSSQADVPANLRACASGFPQVAQGASNISPRAGARIGKASLVGRRPLHNPYPSFSKPRPQEGTRSTLPMRPTHGRGHGAAMQE
jgi:hypothetical protein